MIKERDVFNRYEGMCALLSDVFLVFITMNVIESKKSIKVITWALIILATIMEIVGVDFAINMRIKTLAEIMARLER